MKNADPKPVSLRSQIRIAILTLMALGSHGAVPEVLEEIKEDGRKDATKRRKDGQNTAKVQVAQVRGEVMAEVGIDPGEVNGRLTNDQIAEIKRQLGLKSIDKRVVAALKEHGISAAELRQTYERIAA